MRKVHLSKFQYTLVRHDIMRLQADQQYDSFHLWLQKSYTALMHIDFQYTNIKSIILEQWNVYGSSTYNEKYGDLKISR